MKYLLLLCLLLSVYSYKGISVLGDGTSDVFMCFAKQGFTFNVENIFDEPIGISTALENLKNAKKLNYTNDLFLAVNTSKHYSQADNIMNSIPSNLYGMVWVLVQDWKLSDNCAYLRDILRTIKNYGKRTGIFAESSNWNSMMGDDCQDLGYSESLWYYTGDNNLNFNDFVPFGGWKKPNMKFYTLTTTCGVVGYNSYYP